MTSSMLRRSLPSDGAGPGEPASLDRETELRVQATEAYDEVASLDEHAELVRLILVETSMLVEKYRNVRRHDVPHIAELSGLLDVLWQEIEMARSAPRGLLDAPPARAPGDGC